MLPFERCAPYDPARMEQRACRDIGRNLSLGLVLLAAAACGQNEPPAAPPRPPPPAQAAADDAELQRLVNLARAHYESRQGEQAVRALEQAVRRLPSAASLQLDLARAYLLTRQHAPALAALARAEELAPGSAATLYLSGIAHLREGRYPAAADLLRRAVALEPRDAALRFQLGEALSGTRELAAASAAFEEAVRIDPRHASAWYRLSVCARQGGELERAGAALARFTELRPLVPESARTPEALERCRFMRMDGLRAALPAPPAVAVRFRDAGAGRASVVTGESARERLALLEGADAPDSLLLADRDNDGDADWLALSTAGLRLLDGGPGGADETRAAGLDGVAASDAAWLDYDVDGDLDLLVTGAAGTHLLQNRGRDFAGASDAGLEGQPADGRRLAAGDLDLDEDVDACVATARGLVVLRNAGLGRFRVEPPAEGAQEVLACALEDLDGDGELDVLAATRGAVRIDGSDGRRSVLAPAPRTPSELVLLDFDNDGWTDVLVLGEACRLWRQRGTAGFEDVTEASGLSSTDARRGLALDADGDGDDDLLLATDAGARVLLNDGGNAHRRLVVELTGTRSNRSGVGALVEARAGAFHTTRLAQGRDAGRVVLGLGTRERLDGVRVLWPNGVLQHDLDVRLSVGVPHAVVEKPVPTGSCPFLHAWDGAGMRFVSDILGTSPVGLSAARGVFLPADCEELVALGTLDRCPGRDGRQLVMVSNELREIAYLDRTRLLAADRRPNEEVHATDKLMPPPFPPSELVWIGELRGPRRALDESGADVTAALCAIDGARAGPTRLLPPQMRGLARPASLTLAFDAARLSRPVLVLTGWLRWGDGGVNVAVAQGTERHGAFPALERLAHDGTFEPLPVVVGAPAGRTKTIVCDLAPCLAGHAGELTLRLTSGLEIYWDRIVLAERRPAGTTVELDVLEATLAFRGFAELRQDSPTSPQNPDPTALRADPPWERVLSGACTRYGPVAELLRTLDRRMVILGSGDAVTLSFPAAAAPAPGLVRELFFDSVGWDKDGDYNVGMNQSVDPLPFVGMESSSYGSVAFPWTDELRAWALEYNTRWVEPRWRDR